MAGRMLARKPPMLVRVALANKMARIVWALLARGGVGGLGPGKVARVARAQVTLGWASNKQLSLRESSVM